MENVILGEKLFQLSVDPFQFPVIGLLGLLKVPVDVGFLETAAACGQAGTAILQGLKLVLLLDDLDQFFLPVGRKAEFSDDSADLPAWALVRALGQSS
jgi:hypothetical protein